MSAQRVGASSVHAVVATRRFAAWRGLPRIGVGILRLWPLVALLVLWWLAADQKWLGRKTEYVLPAPDVLYRTALDEFDKGVLTEHIWITLQRVLIAFVLALLVGVGLGLLMGRVSVARAALRPLAAFWFPVPKIAIYPAMVIVLGIGNGSKIGLGFAEAVFPILVATAAAASQVPTPLLWTAQSAGIGGAATLWRVVLPAAVPGVFAGARIGLVGAVIGVFVGEMVVASQGLGNYMVASRNTQDYAQMYLAVLCVSVLGFLLDRLLRLLRAWLVHGVEVTNH